MQRDAIGLEALAARDNLMLAVWKTARGKRERPAVARYLDGLDARLDELATSLVEQRAPLGHARRYDHRRLLRRPRAAPRHPESRGTEVAPLT